MNKPAEIAIEAKLTNLDETKQKVEKLIELMKEARSLAGELASCLKDMKLELSITRNQPEQTADRSYT